MDDSPIGPITNFDQGIVAVLAIGGIIFCVWLFKKHPVIFAVLAIIAVLALAYANRQTGG